MLTPEQIIAAHQANIKTLFKVQGKTFAGLEKLVELNLQVFKSTLGEVALTTEAALSAKDPQELLALQAGLLQPAAEKAAAYGRYVYDIATTTNADISQVAEEQAAEAQKKFSSLIDNSVKNAPAGSENAVALMKSAVAAASNAIESIQKAAKQARDVTEANIQSMTNTAVKATQATTSKKRATA